MNEIASQAWTQISILVILLTRVYEQYIVFKEALTIYQWSNSSIFFSWNECVSIFAREQCIYQYLWQFLEVAIEKLAREIVGLPNDLVNYKFVFDLSTLYRCSRSWIPKSGICAIQQQWRNFSAILKTKEWKSSNNIYHENTRSLWL